MSESRRTLVKLLRTASYETPYFLHVAQKKSQIQWSLPTLNIAARSSRAFDVFHRLNLTPHDFVKEMTQEFARLPRIAKENLEDMQLKSISDREHIDELAEKIVSYACATLLEKEGVLNDTLLTYLKWKNIPACYIRERISEIVTSYINVVLMANIFLAIEKMKHDSLSTFFKKLIRGSHAVACKLTDEEIAKLGYMSKMAKALVRKEIQEKYSVGSLNEIENQAALFAQSLTAQTLASVLLEKENELSEQIKIGKLNVPEKLSFWLEVLLRSCEIPHIFLTIWKIVQINSEYDQIILSPYQKEQYSFCMRHAALIFKDESSTKEVIQILAAAKEVKEEVKPVIIPESKEPAKIPEKMVEAIPLKETEESKPEKAKEEAEEVEAEEKEEAEIFEAAIKDEDYELVSLYSPAINYKVSPFTLFRAAVFGVAEDMGQRFTYGV